MHILEKKMTKKQLNNFHLRKLGNKLDRNFKKREERNKWNWRHIPDEKPMKSHSHINTCRKSIWENPPFMIKF